MENKKKSCEEELVLLRKEYEDFIYIVSHDIKAPLRAISNISNWIEDDLGEHYEGEVKSNFLLLKNRVNRLESMMNSLLDLSRIKRYELEKSKVELDVFVKNIISLVENVKRINIQFDSNLKSNTLLTFSQKLHRVVFSLIDNAVRFHDKKEGNVKVCITESEENVFIEVTDDGPGIPEALEEKIFTLFYTVNSKDLIDTIGAGLALAMKITDFVGGELKLIKQEKRGAKFILTWPKLIGLNNLK
jgi:signal transduction histidine kinase